MNTWRLALSLLFLSAMFPSCALRISNGTEVRVRASLGEGAAAGVALSDARLSLDEITLVPCPGELEAHRWSLLSTARAHHTTADGRSLLESQVSLGDTADLGVLSPPPGRYCAVEVIVAPARAAPLEGHTIRAELVRPRARLEAVGNRLLELPIAPFELNAATPSAELTLRIGLAEALSLLDLSLPGDDLALDLLVALPDHAEALVAVDPPA
ncbi:MAG: hypothetical protein AB8I08_24285 [Sandaracinaceae bacterium]